MFFPIPSPSLVIAFFLSVQFFWAEKHSWMKALQPGLLMSSTETLFSFKTTALHHATEYTLSILHVTLYEQSQSNPSCPKKVNRGDKSYMRMSYFRAGCDDRAANPAESRPEFSWIAFSLLFLSNTSPQRSSWSRMSGDAQHICLPPCHVCLLHTLTYSGHCGCCQICCSGFS